MPSRGLLKSEEELWRERLGLAPIPRQGFMRGVGVSPQSKALSKQRAEQAQTQTDARHAQQPSIAEGFKKKQQQYQMLAMQKAMEGANRIMSAPYSAVQDIGAAGFAKQPATPEMMQRMLEKEEAMRIALANEIMNKALSGPAEWEDKLFDSFMRYRLF